MKLPSHLKPMVHCFQRLFECAKAECPDKPATLVAGLTVSDMLLKPEAPTAARMQVLAIVMLHEEQLDKMGARLLEHVAACKEDVSKYSDLSDKTALTVHALGTITGDENSLKRMCVFAAVAVELFGNEFEYEDDEVAEPSQAQESVE